MLTSLCLSGAMLIASAASPAPGPIPEFQSLGNKRAIKVIKTWLKIYRRGDWDLAAPSQRTNRPGMGRGGRGGRQP